MKIFREHHNGAPAVDLRRLKQSLQRANELDAELGRTITQLAIDFPGDAQAVAAAGIAFRARVNRSASMIELGSAAVDALRRGGWTLTPPVPVVHWTAPPGSGSDTQAAADRENEAERAAQERGIPDDWAG